MVPNDKAFDGKNSFEYNGESYFRRCYITGAGMCKIWVRFVSINSTFRQGLALFFHGFQGKVFLNNKQLKTLKGFKHYIFAETDFPDKEFFLDIEIISGYLSLANSSERIETKMFTCGAYGNAFWYEIIGADSYRFHCNDHEYDDDFDDLIVDVEMLEAQGPHICFQM